MEDTKNSCKMTSLAFNCASLSSSSNEMQTVKEEPLIPMEINDWDDWEWKSGSNLQQAEVAVDEISRKKENKDSDGDEVPSSKNALDYLLKKSQLQKQYEKRMEELKKEIQIERKNTIEHLRGQRPEYSKKENLVLIYYLIATNNILRAKGRDVWDEFVKQKHLPERSYGSIWNQFRNNVLPKIDDFGLPIKIKSLFKELLKKQSRRRS